MAKSRKIKSDLQTQRWKHPGGKLRELGADKLSDAELLAILISTGTNKRTSEDIAKDLLNKFHSFRGFANQPFDKLRRVNGLGDVKIIRIAASFEIARRIVNDVLEHYAKKEKN